MSNDEQVVLVQSFGFRYQGEFAHATLEAAGIPSVLHIDDAGGTYPTLSISSPARLLVREGDLEDAREVLHAHGLLD